MLVRAATRENDLRRFEHAIAALPTEHVESVLSTFLTNVRGHLVSADMFAKAFAKVAEKADQRMKDETLLTIFEKHSQYYTVALVEEFIKVGANVNALHSKCGVTPLFFALTCGDAFTARILLDAGAGLTSSSFQSGAVCLPHIVDGDSVLVAAVAGGCSQLVCALHSHALHTYDLMIDFLLCSWLSFLVNTTGQMCKSLALLLLLLLTEILQLLTYC